MLTAYAMAISSTLCGAVLVENGQRLERKRRLRQSAMALVQHRRHGRRHRRRPTGAAPRPGTALHVAAAIVACAPFAVIAGAVFLIPEKKARVNVQGMKDSFRGLMRAFERRHLWIVAGFMFLYYFSPGMSTPLYYHMTDDLKFSQGYIGIFGIDRFGRLGRRRAGVPEVFRQPDLEESPQSQHRHRHCGNDGILVLWNEPAAAVISFCAGFAAMLATVATITLAADYCPRHAEGFSFAILMSIINLATTLADNFGSFLYTHVFHKSFPPLIMISAAFTAFAFALVPLLQLGDKRQGQAAQIRDRMEPVGPAAR